MTSLRADCVLDAAADLGEGPVWDAARRVCWWVDIDAGVVHRFDPADGRDEVRTVSPCIGAVALRECGTLLLATQDGFSDFDPEVGVTTPLPFTIPRHSSPHVRINDGKCDPAGRFWVGTMARDLAPGAGQSVLRAPG